MPMIGVNYSLLINFNNNRNFENIVNCNLTLPQTHIIFLHFSVILYNLVTLCGFIVLS